VLYLRINGVLGWVGYWAGICPGRRQHRSWTCHCDIVSVDKALGGASSKMRLTLLLILFVPPIFGQSRQDYSCSPAGDSMMVPGEGNHSLSLDLRSKPIEVLRGTVASGGGDNPIGGVLIEVYPHRRTDPNPWDSWHHWMDHNGRIAACFTNPSGGFDIKLPSGLYEVGFSKDGFDYIFALVRIRRILSSSKPIQVDIIVAD
jgi:hypothetical protein